MTEVTTQFGGSERDAAERRVLECLIALIRENPVPEKLASALCRIERSQIHGWAHAVTLSAIGHCLRAGEPVTIDRLQEELARSLVLDEMQPLLDQQAAPFDMFEFERLVDAIPVWIPEPGTWLICSPPALKWMRRKKRDLAIARRARRDNA